MTGRGGRGTGPAPRTRWDRPDTAARDDTAGTVGTDHAGGSGGTAGTDHAGGSGSTAGTDRAGAPGGYLAVDSGGSGLRVAVGTVARGVLAERRSGEPVRTGPRGIDPEHLMGQLVPMVRALTEESGVGRLETVVVGATGLATLGDALRAELPAAVRREFGADTLALAADAVTAYAGALGPRPGAVVAAGTGLIALGTDLTGWRRADGWGHLLGDCGGGAWIGRAGLEAALRAFDGRAGGSTALLACAEREFGPMPGLPGLLYPRTDRPAVLASFAPRVAECAADDQVAAGILRSAARAMAESAAAVCPAGGEPRVAFTGGLFKMGDVLVGPLAEELARLVPGAERVPAAGDPLLGSVRIASELVTGSLTLPCDDALLTVTPVRG
ncbi:BadF/BadG/BcrA/BcrD ATPase family protein [Streptomyces sp. MAA16]|uniref:N-acetylglucosamine kinase n=1 Tax=Streptomyces sp. MAA16 TaxID=3035116 RepID=UPI002473FC60|nr:BadF/BadG/BcrA/BcrD ATPase family protein [Streptomyces sp. MAA16]MDH6697599.1 N-acetylglucosamine kinase-like BadF-type ATPase [Streptomyces sp. MAA16]